MRRTSHPVCVPEQQQLVAELLDAALADPWSGLRQPPRQHPHAPDFERLEQEVARAFPVLVGFRYPAVLRLLYERELPRIDCGLVRLEASAGADPVAHLRAMVFEQYDPERIAGRGLVAIAEEGNDGGPLCVDVRSRPPDDAPVVLWDHESGEVSVPLFDNAAALVRGCSALLRGGRVADLAEHGGRGAARVYDWWDDG